MAESIEELKGRAERDGEIVAGLAERADEYAAALGHREPPSRRAAAEVGALDPDSYSHDERGNAEFRADYQSRRREYLDARVREIGKAVERGVSVLGTTRGWGSSGSLAAVSNPG